VGHEALGNSLYLQQLFVTGHHNIVRPVTLPDKKMPILRPTSNRSIRISRREPTKEGTIMPRASPGQDTIALDIV